MDIVGHDWGAFASWELVLAAPHRFRRHLALSIGHPDTMLDCTSQREVAGQWYTYLSQQETVFDLYASKDGQFFKNVIVPTHPDRDEVWSRLKDPQAMRGMINWDRANPMLGFCLAASKGEVQRRMCHVPTMGIWSSRDTYFPEVSMQRSASSMAATWRYERIEGASHWLQIDRPEKLNRLMVTWLSHG